MVEIGQKLTLVGKTRHAKNRIRENGASVVVVQVENLKRICVTHIENPNAWRWFDAVDDIDWDWELV